MVKLSASLQLYMVKSAQPEMNPSLHGLFAKLDNALIRSDTHLSPYELFYDYNPAWLPRLHSFGEMPSI
jgi:hypothetical protein